MLRIDLKIILAAWAVFIVLGGLSFVINGLMFGEVKLVLIGFSGALIAALGLALLLASVRNRRTCLAAISSRRTPGSSSR